MVDSTNLPDVDINQIATDLNGKMDRDGINASCPTLLSRTFNSNGGVVEIWSDGYCVQTGRYSSNFNNAWITITLDVAYKDTTYNPYATGCAEQSTTGATALMTKNNTKTVNSFQVGSSGEYGAGFTWRTEGYIR